MGDAARDSGNLSGPYLIKKFVLNNINCIGRYVRLSIIPNGVFLFCDEIEVLKNNTSRFTQRLLIPKERLTRTEDSLKNLEFLRDNIANSLDKMERESNNSAINDLKYKTIRKQLENQNISEKDLNNLNGEINKARVLNTRQLFKSSFLIQPYNPWDTLNRFYVPDQAIKRLQYNFYIPKNGAQYGALLIMNNSTASERFQFKVNNISSFTGVTLFSVPFVPSIKGQQVPDPLIPLMGSIAIPPGNVQMIIFKLLGLKQGVSKINITINSAGSVVNAYINTRVFTLPENVDRDALNANVWAYFTRPMISDRKEQAVADLQEHHINTIVIPPAVLPMIQTTDYSNFISYLSSVKEVKNILLFMDYSSLPFRKRLH